MKLLADVNVPKEIVVALRGEGHEVRWLAEESHAWRSRIVPSWSALTEKAKPY